MKWPPAAGYLLRRQAVGYSAAQRILHWTVLLLCLVQVPTSWAIARTHLAHGLIKPDPFDLFLHQVHAWSGWLILAAVAGRLALRWSYGSPPPPPESPSLIRLAATASHAILYGLLMALPITGTIAMYLSFRLAPIHSLLSWMLLAIILAHVTAALWHHFWRRDDVLVRMIGRW